MLLDAQFIIMQKEGEKQINVNPEENTTFSALLFPDTADLGIIVMVGRVTMSLWPPHMWCP